jgi:arylsulfatase A-like enzyme
MASQKGLSRRPGALLAAVRSWACGLLACLGLAACDAGPERPNVLLVVLDDFGYNDLAVNNGSDSPTPTLDGIAARGLRFTRHYTESSCSPSRVGLLTGRYPARVGAHPLVGGIDPELVTLPELLREHGYATHMVGKWHAGDAHREARPEYQGFDHWFGFVNQLYLRGPHSATGYRRGRPTYLDPWLEDERGELRRHRGHLTDILTDHAIGVMQRERDPWFIYLSYYAPHTPIEPADSFRARFPDDPAGRYQALKAQLDANLGRIVDYLESAGRARDTLLVVVSDNGGTARAWPSNLPFFGEKASYYEGGIRTPLLVAWPGRWPENETADRVAMIIDLYPTLAAALDITVPPGLDGIDLFGPERRRELKWYSHNPAGDSLSILSADGQWRFTSWQRHFEWLHHVSDLQRPEPPNRLSEQPETAAGLRGNLLDWVSSATRVEGLSVAGDATWRSFSGADFRRTPLVGSHSMGFLFRRGSGATAAGEVQPLVRQDGYIDITEADGRLHIRVDGNETRVALPAQQACFSLVVSSTLWKTNMVSYRSDRRSRTEVFLNGLPAASSEYANPVLGAASPRNPLEIFSAGEGRWFMPAAADPYLSTRALGADEVSRVVSPGLMTACDAPRTTHPD